MDGTPPAKARKGRKSKSSLVPPVPEGSLSGSKPASETSSLTGEGMSVRTGEGFDVDGTVGDDISVLSLDEGMLRYSCYCHANLSDMVATGQEIKWSREKFYEGLKFEEYIFLSAPDGHESCCISRILFVKLNDKLVLGFQENQSSFVKELSIHVHYT